MNKDYDYFFKIILVGNSSVPKSSLLLKFADNIFSQSYLPSIGIDFKIRSIQCGQNIVKLQIWDTAGQQRFKTITASYFRGTSGIILAYDITNRQSFLDLSNWLIEIQKHAYQDVSKLLVGIKKSPQLSSQVKFQEGQTFAKQNQMGFIEVSIKDGTNVEEAFFKLASQIKLKFKKTQNNKKTELPQPELHQPEISKLSFFQRLFRSKKIQEKKELPKNKEAEKEDKKLPSAFNDFKIDKKLGLKEQEKKAMEKNEGKMEKEEKIKLNVRQDNFYELLSSSGIEDVSVEILKSEKIKSLEDLQYLKDEELKQLGIKLGQIARIRKILWNLK